MPEFPDHFRAFVAACLPDPLLDKIQREQDRLARQAPADAVRWTTRPQLHLTLKFYGNVPTIELETLVAALRRAATDAPPITLSVTGFGCFPSPQRPRVLWFGLTGDVAALEQVQARIEQETARFGAHSEDRPFYPHLTVGRLTTPGPAARRIGELVQSTEVPSLGQWQVNGLTLMQSRLSPAGSTYTALAELPFQASRR